MAEANPALAEIIEASAPAYAAAAANRLFADNAALKARYGSGAAATWRAHLLLRLQELAAAVRLGEPRLFANRLVWQQQAFTARNAGSDDLRLSLAALGATLTDELPDDLSDVPATYLQAGLNALDVTHAPVTSVLDPKDPCGALALKYLLACLEGDVQLAIRTILEAADSGTPAETLYIDVLFAAQREIGRMWHGGEVSVAEEHVVTQTTQTAMTLLAQRCTPAETIDKTVLAAAVALDMHDIGIRAVADFFQMAGWRVLSLGSDLPPSEIARAAKIFDVDLVVLGATLSTQLKQLQLTIENVRAECGDGVGILVGGHVFADIAGLWKNLGADGHASNAGEALKLGAKLVGLPRPA